MKVYTEAEYDRLYRESLEYEQIESNLRGFDKVVTAKSQWGEEQYRYANLSSGINLDIVDEQILLDRNDLVKHDNCQSVVAKFYLSGYHSVISPGIKGVAAEYAETKGENYLFYLPDIEEIEQSWSGDRLKMLRIELNLDIIRRFVTKLNTVPKQLQELIEDDKPQRFHFALGNITPQMQTIIEQIWHHPYQGAIAQMYLEGKVLELLAMQLSQLTTNCNNRNTLIKFKPREIDRIHEARKILLNDLDNPPSIKTLAKTVGISDRKLQQGFKEIYGTTVFNYLHNYRLQQAQLMLREGNLSVAAVANNIGYAHLGHFSAAFRRKFGITPRDCLKGKLQNIKN